MGTLLGSRCRHGAIIATIWAILTLPAIGQTSFWDIDEGLNAEAAREMLESGDWVVPYFNFQPRTAKPPLLYWLQALAYRTFGVNEWSARFPSALAALAAALLSYRLGRRMFSPMTGLLAAIVLLSTVQMCVLSQAATPDAVLLACLVLTLNLFWEPYACGSRRWLWATGLGCGLAALAKGPIGVLLPLGIVSYFLLAQRQLRRLFDLRLLGGIFLVVLVAGPWYALVGAQTHGAFLRAFWQNDNFGRFVSSMEGHRGPFWYYLATVTLGLTPWCIFLFPALWDAWRREKGVGSHSRPQLIGNDSRPLFLYRATERDAVRFLICWASVYLGFFSLAQTKLPNYVLPAFPPLALLIGRYLERWRTAQADLPNWVVPIALACLGAIGTATVVGELIAGGALLPSLLHGRAITGLAPWALLGAIPIVGAVIAGRLCRASRRGATIATVSVTAVVFLGSVTAGPIHVVDAQKAPKALIAEAGANRPSDEVRIASFCWFQPSIVFYSGREVAELPSERAAIDFLRGPLPSYLLCPADTAAVLQLRLPQARLLSRRRDFYKGWEIVVLANSARSIVSEASVLTRAP